MEYKEFLNKETPADGGCMLCLAKYMETEYDVYQKKQVTVETQEYFLIERHKCSNGDIFTINKYPYYEYQYDWDRCVCDWEILYKKEIW